MLCMHFCLLAYLPPPLTSFFLPPSFVPGYLELPDDDGDDAKEDDASGGEEDEGAGGEEELFPQFMSEFGGAGGDDEIDEELPENERGYRLLDHGYPQTRTTDADVHRDGSSPKRARGSEGDDELSFTTKYILQLFLNE